MIPTKPICISLSIVSHAQGKLIEDLFKSLRPFLDKRFNYEIILTINISEDEGFLKVFSGYPLSIIRNTHPKGYGENHNSAFKVSSGDFFVVMNPDLVFTSHVFDCLIEALQDLRVGVCAPLVLNNDGEIQDSARKYPTIRRLFKRFFDRLLIQKTINEVDYKFSQNSLTVEWIAGMFMVFRREIYSKVQGFDERYFMYMEDADICRRLNELGYIVLFVPKVSLIHNARHASRKLTKYKVWHFRSAVRFLFGI